MEKDFFADKNWPFSLQVSGSFVHSPREPLGNDRFIDHRFYHHFSSALTDMLSLTGGMFEQELLPHGPKSTLYKEVAIVHTATKEELVSFFSIPLSSAIATGDHPGLYLAYADPAAQIAGKYKSPLAQLSHYDPGSILQLVADYDTNHKHFIRLDPQLEKVLATLNAKRAAEIKDTHQVLTTYHGQGGGFQLAIGHHFGGLAPGMDGLFHHPLFTRRPLVSRTLSLTAPATTLRDGQGDIATIHFEHYQGKGQQPPAGYHLSFHQDPAALQKSLGINLSALPRFNHGDKDHFIIALAEGGRPVEVAAFTALRVKFHDQVVSARKALKRPTGPGKNIFPPGGTSLSH